MHTVAHVCPQCKTSQSTPKATGIQGFTLSGTAQGQECLALNKCLNSWLKSIDFSDCKQDSIAKLLALNY